MLPRFSLSGRGAPRRLYLPVVTGGFYPMQALKALVIFMAVLIVAGMVLLVYGLITRTGGDGEQAAAPAAPGVAPAGVATTPDQAGGTTPAVTPPAVTPFGTLDLAVPDGCSLAASELAGDRLVVRFTGQPARGCQLLVIVDLASGREIGRVKAVPSSAETAP